MKRTFFNRSKDRAYLAGPAYPPYLPLNVFQSAGVQLQLSRNIPTRPYKCLHFVETPGSEAAGVEDDDAGDIRGLTVSPVDSFVYVDDIAMDVVLEALPGPRQHTTMNTIVSALHYGLPQVPDVVAIAAGEGGAHELGHSYGLHHNDVTPRNIMASDYKYSTSQNLSFSAQQVADMRIE